MPISRFIFFASKHRSTQSLRTLMRSDPCKKFQPSSFATPARSYHGKPRHSPIMNVETGTRTSRSWSTYAIPGAVIGFVGVASLIRYNDERRSIPKGCGNTCAGSSGMGPIIGGPFTLVDTENKVVTEKTLLGNWILLYFGYTSSPTIGPEQVDIMAKAVDIIESKQSTKVLPVFVTIDPQRDTPSQLRAYLKEFDPRIVGLTGPASAIRQMAQEYRIFFKKVEEDGDDYLIESCNIMYLMNPKMEVVRCFGPEYRAQDLAEAVFDELKTTPP